MHFPVILFNPGLGNVAENYENFILNLVSYGYIVVAINNTFVGGPIQFPDGRVVNAIYDASDKQITDTVPADIRYVYQQIHRSHDTNSIFSSMNLDEIGLLGHSVGAYMAVELAHQKPKWFKAVVALDAPGLPASSDMLEGFAIPFMHMHAANWRTTYPDAGVFHLTQNEYFVLLTPDVNIINYSRHNNFSDISSLQYHPAIQLFSNYQAERGIPWILDVGSVDGYEATGIINNYLLRFFDNFLKKYLTRLSKIVFQFQIL
jgi:pimeloyl-ACP methyl ester carboxylesterase